MTEDAKRRARPRQQELVQNDSPDDMPYEGNVSDPETNRGRAVGRAKSIITIDNPDDAEL